MDFLTFFDYISNSVMMPILAIGTCVLVGWFTKTKMFEEEITKNGEQFGYWDGNDFYTGNLVVRTNERAQFGKYAYVPRSDGSLMFLKVK